MIKILATAFPGSYFLVNITSSRYVDLENILRIVQHSCIIITSWQWLNKIQIRFDYKRRIYAGRYILFLCCDFLLSFFKLLYRFEWTCGEFLSSNLAYKCYAFNARGEFLIKCVAFKRVYSFIYTYLNINLPRLSLPHNGAWIICAVEKRTCSHRRWDIFSDDILPRFSSVLETFREKRRSMISGPPTSSTIIRSSH